MSFPATQVTLDVFDRADGAPGANWVGPVLGFPGNNTITGRRMAAGNVAGSSSGWAKPMAGLNALYAQVSTLPPLSGGLGVELDLVSDLNALTGNMACILQWSGAAWEVSLTTRGGGAANGVLAHFNAGDWFAAKFDPVTITLTGWYYDSQLGASWAQAVTLSATDAFAAGTPKATQGWTAALTFNDTGTAKVSAFGAETLPGTNTSLTAPIVHGHGAC